MPGRRPKPRRDTVTNCATRTEPTAAGPRTARASGHGRHAVNAARPYAPFGPKHSPRRPSTRFCAGGDRHHRFLAHLGPFRDAVDLFGTIAGSARWPRAASSPSSHRHEPLPHQRTPHLVRRHVPQERRVRGQAPLQPPARGCPWLTTTLVQCAWAAVRGKGGHLCPVPKNPSPSRSQKAILAVAASILTAAYHMLRDGTPTAIPAPDTSNNATAKPGQATHRTPSRSRISRPDQTEPDMIKHRASSERKDGLAPVARATVIRIS